MILNGDSCIKMSKETGVSAGTVRIFKRLIKGDNKKPSKDERLALIKKFLNSKPRYSQNIGNIAKNLGVSIATASRDVRGCDDLKFGTKKGKLKKLAVVF